MHLHVGGPSWGWIPRDNNIQVQNEKKNFVVDCLIKQCHVVDLQEWQTKKV